MKNLKINMVISIIFEEMTLCSINNTEKNKICFSVVNPLAIRNKMIIFGSNKKKVKILKNGLLFFAKNLQLMGH